jgi:hypothetical protein
MALAGDETSITKRKINNASTENGVASARRRRNETQSIMKNGGSTKKVELENRQWHRGAGGMERNRAAAAKMSA